jgi:hypothetical protein
LTIFLKNPILKWKLKIKVKSLDNLQRKNLMVKGKNKKDQMILERIEDQLIKMMIKKRNIKKIKKEKSLKIEIMINMKKNQKKR